MYLGREEEIENGRVREKQVSPIEIEVTFSYESDITGFKFITIR